jgi:histone deacetylase 11
VRPNHDDTHYLGAVDRALSAALDEFKPDFVVYNAGTDIMDGDPLGNLHISAQGVVMRDQLVFSRVLEREQPIPLLMVLSGGYQHSNAPCIAESIVNLSRRFRRYFSAR